jgi:hypothetical protein
VETLAVSCGPDNPWEGRLMPSGLLDMWPLGPLDVDERQEQDERFSLLKVCTLVGFNWGVWDDAYKRLAYGGKQREAEAKVEELRVACALWEERIARGSTREETEELVEAMTERLRQTAHEIRAGWLGVLRTDRLDAELYLEAFLADARSARHRARSLRLWILV